MTGLRAVSFHRKPPGKGWMSSIGEAPDRACRPLPLSLRVGRFGPGLGGARSPRESRQTDPCRLQSSARFLGVFFRDVSSLTFRPQ